MPRGVVRIRERGQIDSLVLAVLATGEHDGYEVMRTLRRRVGTVLEVPPSRVFPTLHRLARNRLVARSTTDGRRYHLTATGTRSLADRAAVAQDFAEALRTLQDAAPSPARRSSAAAR